MSTNNIEITMPDNVTEVTLKTAGTYCDRDVVVKKTSRAVTGSFTQDENVVVLSGVTGQEQTKYTFEGIPTDAMMVVIKGEDITTDNLGNNPYMNIEELYACLSYQKANIDTINPNASTIAQVRMLRKGTSGNVAATANINVLHDSEYTSLCVGGSLTGGQMLLQANKTYNWTAYYWDLGEE